MAFWKFTGAATEFYPTAKLTAKPGYVYDFGNNTPPTEVPPREGTTLTTTNLWTSDPGPATDTLSITGDTLADFSVSPVQTIVATATLHGYHCMVYVTSGTFTLTMGTDMKPGQLVYIVNSGAGTVTVAKTGSGTVNGAASATVATGTMGVLAVAVAGTNPIALLK